MTGELIIECARINEYEGCLFDASTDNKASLILKSKSGIQLYNLLRTKSKDSNIYVDGIDHDEESKFKEIMREKEVKTLSYKKKVLVSKIIEKIFG